MDIGPITRASIEWLRGRYPNPKPTEPGSELYEANKARICAIMKRPPHDEITPEWRDKIRQASEQMKEITFKRRMVIVADSKQVANNFLRSFRRKYAIVVTDERDFRQLAGLNGFVCVVIGTPNGPHNEARRQMALAHIGRRKDADIWCIDDWA